MNLTLPRANLNLPNVYHIFQHAIAQTITFKTAAYTFRSWQPDCLFGVFSICGLKFISPYHYWSARRQGLWWWQPGLSDLGADQQPVWAQGPGWIYFRADSRVCIPLSHAELSHQEAASEWDIVCFFSFPVVLWITEVMRLEVSGVKTSTLLSWLYCCDRLGEFSFHTGLTSLMQIEK